MPWHETEPVNEGMKFVVALQRGLSMTEACQQFGISRKAGYKIRARFEAEEPSSPPVLDAAAPNDAWSIDYKGWCRVGDGTRCDPLTVNDMATRSSLVCRAIVAPKLEDVKLRL